MTEAKFRAKVVKLLAPLLAFPVENYVADGAPDICCTAGWLELKIAGEPRANGVIPVRVRPAQKLWLRAWRAAGQPAWTLTAYHNAGAHWIWLLHDATWSCDNLGMVDLETLTKASVWWWVVEPSSAELIMRLIGGSRA